MHLGSRAHGHSLSASPTIMFRTVARSSLRQYRTTLNVIPILTQPTICRRLLSNETRSTIQKAVESHPLVLFMKGTPERPECGFSRAVVQIMELHGVPPEKMKTYNVLEDPELRAGIKEFSEWPTVPQMYVGGDFVGGCDIVLGMHQSGELEGLLEQHDIIPKILDENVHDGI